MSGVSFDCGDRSTDGVKFFVDAEDPEVCTQHNIINIHFGESLGRVGGGGVVVFEVTHFYTHAGPLISQAQLDKQQTFLKPSLIVNSQLWCLYSVL